VEAESKAISIDPVKISYRAVEYFPPLSLGQGLEVAYGTRNPESKPTADCMNEYLL